MEPYGLPKISFDLLRGLADYAKVKLSEDRLERTKPRLELYLNDVSRLDDVDINDTEPAVNFSTERVGNDDR